VVLHCALFDQRLPTRAAEIWELGGEHPVQPLSDIGLLDGEAEGVLERFEFWIEFWRCLRHK
jgi:hypothetical protein